jgi:hypothetical protein
VFLDQMTVADFQVEMSPSSKDKRGCGDVEEEVFVYKHLVWQAC